MPGKYEYLMRACAIMANGELSFSGVIEASRIQTALRYIGSKITSDEIWFLAFKSKLGSIETEESGEKKLVAF